MTRSTQGVVVVVVALCYRGVKEKQEYHYSCFFIRHNFFRVLRKSQRCQSTCTQPCLILYVIPSHSSFKIFPFDLISKSMISSLTLYTAFFSHFHFFVFMYLFKSFTLSKVFLPSIPAFSARLLAFKSIADQNLLSGISTTGTIYPLQLG